MSDNKICLGAVVGVHGIRGEVKVKSFSDDERNLTRYGEVTNEAGDKKFSLKIIGHSKELLRVKIKGVDDRNTAETLVGTAFYVNRDLLPDLKEDEFYHTDLIGLDVKNSNGEIIGEVNALYNFGAGDIIELKLNAGSLEMLPFTKEYVPEVKVCDGYVKVSSTLMNYAPDDEKEFSDEG